MKKKSIFLASWPIRELLWIGAGRPHVWPTDCLSAPQAYQCKITKSTVMATQMQLEVILARNRIPTDVLWSRLPFLKYTEILGRENWERVKSRIGGETTRARVCLFTKPCNMSDLKDLKKKKARFGKNDALLCLPQLSYEGISKIHVNLSRVHLCKR